MSALVLETEEIFKYMFDNIMLYDIMVIALVGDPVKGEDFFNRKEELELLKRRIDSYKKGKKRNVALIGLRKIGKTSIIFELKRIYQNIIIVYIYLPEVNAEVFVDKCINSLLFELATYKKIKIESWYDTKEIISRLIKFMPETSSAALKILDKPLNEKYRLIFDLFNIAKKEAGKEIVIVFDEFQRIVSYKHIQSPLDVFREKTMQQDIMYIISGSAVSMMNKMVSLTESPLYGHFEIMFVKNFKYESARKFIRKKLYGLDINEFQIDFFIHFTNGNPFYLDILTFKVRDICERKSLNRVSTNLITNAIADELFVSSGTLYNYFKFLIEENLEKRGFNTFVKIMNSIANDKNSITEIHEFSGISVTSLPRLLRRLMEMDILTKKGTKYYFVDDLLRFWFRYVYTVREESYIPELGTQIKQFKSQIEQIILSFKRELGKARESQIREIFTKKGYKVDSGLFNGEEFDLIIKDDDLILGEIKTKNVDTKEVNKFINKIRKVKNVKQKILFALFGIDSKARKICKKENIEIWDLDKVNRERKKCGLTQLKL